MDKLLNDLAGIPAATLYEAAGRHGDMSPLIRCLVPNTRFVGVAYTLRTQPGDNLGVLHAIDAARPGEVLVIDGGGTERLTIWGGTSSLAAKVKGLAGCVTNAAVRDIDESRELRFPLFAPCTSVRGATKYHPGWHQIPVCVGDVVVHPGDIVIGDADGVLVLNPEQAAKAIPAAVAAQARQSDYEKRIRDGQSLRSALNI